MSTHEAELPADPTRDEARDGQWLTYAEFGRIRGMTRESAKKLALKQGWRRVPGNDGANRVLVPVTWLTSKRESSRDQPREKSRAHPAVETRDNSRDIRSLLESVTAGLVAMRADTEAYGPAFETALKAIEAAHASEVAVLREQIAAAEQVSIGMQALADRALAQLADAAARADRAELATTDLRGALEQAQAAAAAATQAVETLKAAETERQAAGLLTRLTAALRGR